MPCFGVVCLLQSGEGPLGNLRRESVTFWLFVVVSSHHIFNMSLHLGHRPRPNVGLPIQATLWYFSFWCKPKTNSQSSNTEYLTIITQYMTSDIHLTDTTHCPEMVFTTHNSTPHERKIGKENMTPKGTRNTTQNILSNIQPLQYKSMHCLFNCYTRQPFPLSLF